MALHRLVWIETLTKQMGKEGLVSPMTPVVGKIPWHLRLYGSEILLLLLLLLLSIF